MKKTNAKHSAFTLIEVLVVIAIIGILASLLLPALGRAKSKGRTVKCISNQQQIGKAFMMYATDNTERYPVVAGSAGSGGVQGNFTTPTAAAQLYGAATPTASRPLNKYVGTEIFRCPADIGGGAYNVQNCYLAFGSSYQPQVADDMFRVKRVLGEATEVPGSYEAASMNEAEIAVNAVNKIIQGDWNWPYDRDDMWHASAGKRGHVMLFGDGHVEFFVFPPNMTNWLLAPAPDPSFTWW